MLHVQTRRFRHMLKSLSRGEHNKFPGTINGHMLSGSRQCTALCAATCCNLKLVVIKGRLTVVYALFYNYVYVKEYGCETSVASTCCTLDTTFFGSRRRRLLVWDSRKLDNWHAASLVRNRLVN